MGKPNILFIFPDQQRGDALGAVGNNEIITPNLDDLAGRGVTFTRCSTSSPVCMPARASLATGRYVCEHGLWNNGAAVSPEAHPSLMRGLKDAGYHTSLIGKAHLTNQSMDFSKRHHARELEGVMRQWGFDEINEMQGPISSTLHGSYYTDELEAAGLLEAHRGYMAEFVVRHYYKRLMQKDASGGWARLIEKYGIQLPKPGEFRWLDGPSPLPDEYHMDAWAGEKTLAWLDAYDREEPFFLQVGFTGPHDPFDSLPGYRAMYDLDRLSPADPRPPSAPMPPYLEKAVGWYGLESAPEEVFRRMKRDYYAKITLIDAYVGRIMRKLEEKGLAEDTWVIYNSDHGELLGDHRLSHKGFFYEGALRVPLIIVPPGGAAQGWQTQAITDHLDIAATMLDIAGTEPITGARAVSLKDKVLEGAQAPGAQLGKPHVFSEIDRRLMVRDERHKLVMDVDERRVWEFYDLETDPGEHENLAGSNAAALTELESVACEHLDRYQKR